MSKGLEHQPVCDSWRYSHCVTLDHLLDVFMPPYPQLHKVVRIGMSAFM